MGAQVGPEQGKGQPADTTNTLGRAVATGAAQSAGRRAFTWVADRWSDACDFVRDLMDGGIACW